MDHKVKLERLHTGKATLEVTLEGLDEQPELLKDLWVLLEPVADIPVWASRHCFGGVMDLRKARVDKEGRARFEGLPAEGYRIRLTYGNEEVSTGVPEDISQSVFLGEEPAKSTLPVNAKRLGESHRNWQNLLGFRERQKRAASKPAADAGK